MHFDPIKFLDEQLRQCSRFFIFDVLPDFLLVQARFTQKQFLGLFLLYFQGRCQSQKDTVQLLGHFGFFLRLGIITPIVFGYFRKISGSCWRNHINFLRHFLGNLNSGIQSGTCFLHQGIHHLFIETVHPRVIELRSNGTENGKLVFIGMP